MKMLARTIALPLLLLAMLAGRVFPQTLLDDNPPLRQQVDALVNPLIDGEAAVGLAIGLLRDGQRQAVGYGKMDAANEHAPDGNTVFEIGSVTKVFTSIALADMAERQLVSLDEPVQKLLPDSVHIPSREGHEITLLHLATHTSGLPRMPDNLAPADPTNPYADYTVEQMYAFLSGHSLARDPGERMEYSNLGAGLLGHALSLRAGQGYEALIADRVLTPLGMTSTAITLNDDLRSRLASGHDSEGNPAPNWDLPTLAGAGALRSTANDLLVFLAANLGLVETPLAKAIEASHVRRHEEKSPPIGIALGWHFFPNGNVLWHNGQTGGYHCYVAFDTQRKSAVAVLSNSATMLVDELGARLLAVLAGEMPKAISVRIPAKVDPAVFDSLAGRYQLAPNFVIAVTSEDERLFAQVTGQGKFRLFPESETEFFLKVVDAQVTFVKDEEGATPELILHQNGRDLTAKRIKEDK